MLNTTTSQLGTVREELKREIGLLMPAYEMRDTEVVKFNDRKLLGFTAVRDGDCVGPTLWANDFLPAIEDGYSVKELALGVISKLLILPPEIKDIREKASAGDVFDKDFSKIKEKVRPRIAEIERNSEYLADIPHRDLGAGLTLFASVDLGANPFGSYMCVLNNAIIQDRGYDIDEVLDAALENVKPIMMPIEASIFANETGAEVPNLLEHPELFSRTDHLFVLTNDDQFNGAAALFAPGVMDRIFGMMGTFYVIPSSIHELLLVPANSSVEPSALPEMIRGANSSVVEAEDILSDKLRIFDGKELKEVQNV